MTPDIPISEHLLKRVLSALDSGQASSEFIATIRDEEEARLARASVEFISKVKADLEKARGQAEASAMLAPPAGDSTCADEARITEALFKIGDQVRLKSERRFMTVASLDCIDVTCHWFDGSALEEADFHRDMLTAEPYPDHVPF